MSNNSPEILLGKKVIYVDQYAPQLLFSILRKTSRDTLNIVSSALPFQGVDIWNAYEVSWLNSKGKPQVACAQFTVPCQSPHIIESKSFKLYLNSFNQSRFVDWPQVKTVLQQDLSACAGSPVEVTLMAVTDKCLAVADLVGDCLDDFDIEITHYVADPKLLSVGAELVNEQLTSHLLRSLCPVTGQPDWASLSIEYSGAQINRESLLQYIIGYRQHQEYHEQCVERIYSDIMQQCQPQHLSVYARYVRRGGLDINPFRSSSVKIPQNIRLHRQ